MKKSSKIILLAAIILIVIGLIYIATPKYEEIDYTTLANTNIGTVEVGVAGNESAPSL